MPSPSSPDMAFRIHKFVTMDHASVAKSGKTLQKSMISSMSHLAHCMHSLMAKQRKAFTSWSSCWKRLQTVLPILTWLYWATEHHLWNADCHLLSCWWIESFEQHFQPLQSKRNAQSWNKSWNIRKWNKRISMTEQQSRFHHCPGTTQSGLKVLKDGRRKLLFFKRSLHSPTLWKHQKDRSSGETGAVSWKHQQHQRLFQTKSSVKPKLSPSQSPHIMHTATQTQTLII